MIRKYKNTLIVTSLLTLFPIVVGLILWNKLPESMATHWGIHDQADGYSSLPFAVFAPPLFMLAVHWICVWFTAKDPSNQDRNAKPQKLVLWIIPLLSNLCSGLMYALALGVEFSVTGVMVVFMGLLFAVIGNYLPKCKTNSTIGIKVFWTYTSEENWNATHRFGGRLWVIGGTVIAMLGLFLGDRSVYMMLASIIVMAIAPTLYSYLYYRKQRTQGEVLSPLPAFTKKSRILAVVILIPVLILLVLLLFVGEIEYVYSETGISIAPDFHRGVTIDYDVIDSIEYRDENMDGTRVYGYGSMKLLLGTFENEEFGTYARYTYYDPGACIVITVDDLVFVISGADTAETKEIYERLTAAVN